LVDVGSVELLELFDQGTQCVLRQFQLIFERLDPVLYRIGFAIVAVHQTRLYDFPKNAHFSPRFIVAVSNQLSGLVGGSPPYNCSARINAVNPARAGDIIVVTAGQSKEDSAWQAQISGSA
jgi:hypothetical protein